MWKRLVSTIVGLSFMITPLHAFAHDGGLDRDGCHNETATGGYHCHRNDGDEGLDWETAGIVAGGLLLLAIVATVVTGQKGLWLTDTGAAGPRMGVIPYLAGNDAIGLDAYYDVNPSSRLGVRMVFGENDGEQAVATGAAWNLWF